MTETYKYRLLCALVMTCAFGRMVNAAQPAKMFCAQCRRERRVTADGRVPGNNSLMLNVYLTTCRKLGCCLTCATQHHVRGLLSTAEEHVQWVLNDTYGYPDPGIDSLGGLA